MVLELPSAEADWGHVMSIPPADARTYPIACRRAEQQLSPVLREFDSLLPYRSWMSVLSLAELDDPCASSCQASHRDVMGSINTRAMRTTHISIREAQRESDWSHTGFRWQYCKDTSWQMLCMLLQYYNVRVLYPVAGSNEKARAIKNNSALSLTLYTLSQT